ncbi:peptidylprolyl isomerase [Phormidium tenue]|uniref:Peptidyl-prolyl cis-trans isomerase n=1 Tax=Phormidium tenue NIES-30 TaxID=549789 RepID=A0A1U7J372_9CYAN|nr:peptidylprolyl isomerase [Phormidium tenue]MBD2233196.1 peptidylprolyl isomerase [Phormidium tenue FACHB-1052]OKH46625.1 peptidylprolyl isomerase [Phormidium tenue NIES-30]
MALSTRPFTLALATLLTLWLGACTSAPSLDSTSEAPTDPGLTESVAVAPTGLPILEGTATVEMVVNGSPIVMELDGANAPITAGNFVDLVNRGVYDGLVFHRVVRDPEPFVAQGGDPQSKDPSVPAQQLGTGSFIDPETQAPRYVPLEIKPAGAAEPIYSQTLEEARISEAPELPHTRGAVAMARSQAVDSASAQFYITLAELPFLDGSYAVFGYVTSGMEVVDAIQQGDRIESARVTAGLENLKTE